jgi:hypothetical protein
MKDKIHYVYKIINLKNNKEYIGVRSHPNPKEDTYMGSSRILENLYKLEGKKNFIKEILKTFSSRKEAEDYESSLLTENFCNSPNTYNIINTGEFNDNKHGFRKDIWFDYYDEIREKYTQGKTTEELGGYYNCDGGTIRMIIQDIKRTNSESQKLRYGKFLTSGNRDLELDKHIGDIVKLYVEDVKSLIHISKQYGVDQGTIKRRLIVEGVVIRDHKVSQQLRNDNRKRAKAWNFEKEIVSLFLQGVNIPTLSKTYESDYMTIKTILQHNKLK